MRCEAQCNYIKFYFTNKDTFTVSRTLKEFEDLLNEQGFCRVHDGHLINLLFIKRYNKGDGGQVEMEDGSIIDVTHRRKDNFLNIF